MTDCVNKIVTKGVMYGYVRMKITDSVDKTQYSWSVWTIFVQSSEGHEMSDYVDHVTFYLHKDFSDNVRTVFNPPYETSTLGALDSYAYAYIFFKDPIIPPQFFQIFVDCTNEVYKKQVRYDNLIFVRPNLQFYRKLQIIRPATRYSGVLHHIQPELFRQLYPHARLIQYRPGLSLEELVRAMQEAEQATDCEGVGGYLMDAVRSEKSADKIIEQSK